MPDQTRQLAAIMFTDIVGYTALMEADENTALALIKKNRAVHQSAISQHQGKWVKEMGDGTLAYFNTSSEAVYCAGAIQKACEKENIPLRIGIHLGEVTVDRNDIFGDGVNIASRIEPIAESGQILVSESIYGHVKNMDGITYHFVKETQLKNLEDSIRLYSVAVKSNKKFRTGIGEKTKDVIIASNSIAVLPFVNMSNDPEQEYFCDGISEEIINTIVQYPNLKVSGRTSSFSFKGKNEDLRAIGKALGVSKVLEGSIRKSGNRIRITAQLIETSNGFHLWSNKYDRQLDDIFAIQDEIAVEIGNQLNLRLASGIAKIEIRKQTQNIEAYETYLKGRGLLYERGKSMFEAIECFKRALEIDSEYALASAGLSDTYVMLILHGYLPAKDTWKLAIDAANNAFKNGPELAETHNSLAIISLFFEWNWDKAEQQFKKAIKINPFFIQAYVWYGYFHQVFVRGKMNSGVALIEKAIEIDPLSGYPRMCLGSIVLNMGEFKSSVKLGEMHVKIDPLNNLGQLNLGTAYYWTRDYEKASLCFDQSSKKAGIMWLYTLVLLHLKQNNIAKAKEVYNTIEDQYERHNLTPTTFAIVCASFGEDEKAIKALKTACEVKDPALVMFAVHHKDGEVLHNLPGYDDIRKEMGI